MHIRRIRSFLASRLCPKVVSATCLVAAADFLFFRQDAGWTLGLFGILLLVAIVLHNPHVVATRPGKSLFIAGSGLTLALVNDPGGLAICLLALDVVLLVSLPTLPVVDARTLPRNLAGCLANATRLFCDIAAVLRSATRRRHSHIPLRRIAGRWLLLAGASAVFVWLFAAANPVVGSVFAAIDWTAQLDLISIPRVLFWIVAGTACWSTIRPRIKARAESIAVGLGSRPSAYGSLLFNRQSIHTSLILFNILFFFQNVSDVLFLWSGAELPHGMSYADYAHQGAYPLMVTAVLAAAFVLLALKPGSDPEATRLIRRLVYVWVAQNVFLVMSAALRMVKYIEAYSLTQLRVVVLIWMVLVALGLILIVTRIATDRTNRWLVNVNALALTVTLYACCFADMPGMIAQYDVRHCWDITGEGPGLDVAYVAQMAGTSAIPAFAWYQKHAADSSADNMVLFAQTNLLRERDRHLGDWRRWTWHEHRLLRVRLNDR